MCGNNKNNPVTKVLLLLIILSGVIPLVYLFILLLTAGVLPKNIDYHADFLRNQYMAVVFLLLFLYGANLATKVRSIASLTALLPLLVFSIWPVFRESRELPPDAIVAFLPQISENGEILDKETPPCPLGWEPEPRLNGRMTLGAISDSNKNSDLTPRTVGDIGGSEAVSLTTEEMPRHSHEWETPFLPTRGNRPEAIGGQNPPAAGDDRTPVGGTGWRLSQLKEVGGQRIGDGSYLLSAPHDNMPPFVVVQYCKRI